MRLWAVETLMGQIFRVVATTSIEALEIFHTAFPVEKGIRSLNDAGFVYAKGAGKRLGEGSMTIEQAMVQRNKLWVNGCELHAESAKLYAEGDKLLIDNTNLFAEAERLRHEGSILRAEGNKLRAKSTLVVINAVIKKHGPEAKIEFESNKVKVTPGTSNTIEYEEVRNV